MELTGPRPRPLLPPLASLQLQSPRYSSQFGSFPHRQLGQHSSILSKWYSNFYLCLNTSASARPRTRQNEKGYTPRAWQDTGYWTRLRTARQRTTYNVERTRRVCIKKHDMARAISFVFLFLLCSYLCSFCFCAPLLPSFPSSSLLSCFLFLGCVQTYFFPYSSAL